MLVRKGGVIGFDITVDRNSNGRMGSMIRYRLFTRLNIVFAERVRFA
jgi:hypothetical protein